jgi:hypothetical protein
MIGAGVGAPFVENPSGKLYLKFQGQLSGGTRNRRGYCEAKIIIEKTDGQYIFETAPTQTDQEIYYEIPQEFEIENGYHKGIEQDQTDTLPAKIELEFFNCYSFGNGVESYRVRDALLGNYLNIDTRPTSTSIEKYKEIRRFADWTFSEAYIESTGINGLNVFNLSTGNFKEEINNTVLFKNLPPVIPILFLYKNVKHLEFCLVKI